MDLVSCTNVTKRYDLGDTRVTALEAVTLTIGRGELVGVCGPSGSGKSTLLNLLGALDEPTGGRVTFDGQDLAELDDDTRSAWRNRRIGFVFQQFNLLPVLTALENVMLPLQIQGQPVRDCRDRARRRLEQVGLGAQTGRRPDKLSGGQRQRVAIARALVTRPDLVIADEPTASLDSTTARAIVQLMGAINRGEGATFVLATHDRRLLNDVHRRIHLVDGRLPADAASCARTGQGAP